MTLIMPRTCERVPGVRACVQQDTQGLRLVLRDPEVIFDPGNVHAKRVLGATDDAKQETGTE